MTIIGRTRPLGLKGKIRHRDFEDYIVNYSVKDGFEVHSHRTVKFKVEPDGDVFIGENVAAAATTNLAIFTTAQTYNSESVGAGDMLIGDNTASKANIYWDKSTGKLQFRGGTTMQVEIGTDGKVTAGGGVVVIDTSGISIEQAGTDNAWQQSPEKINFFNTLYSTTTQVAEVKCFRDPDDTTHMNVLELRAQRTTLATPTNSQGGRVIISGNSGSVTNPTAQITLGPLGGTGGDGDCLILYSAKEHRFTGGFNAGTATGAGAGDVRYSGDLESYRNSTYYTGYAFVPLTTPLTSTSWDGDSYSTTAKTLIDLSAVFTAPAGIKAILAYVSIRDSGSAAGDPYIILSPNDTASSGLAASCAGLTNDAYARQVLTVPCDVNGDVYYQIAATGASTMDVYIQIWGYWI